MQHEVTAVEPLDGMPVVGPWNEVVIARSVVDGSCCGPGEQGGISEAVGKCSSTDGEVDASGKLLGGETLGWMGTSVDVVGVGGDWSKGLLGGRYFKSSRIDLRLLG